MMMQITKLDSARRQLLAAIHIQWYMTEPIAAYQLAANSAEICDALLKLEGNVRMRERLMEVHGISEREARLMVNIPRNFTKHADNDPHATMEDIRDVDADALVMTACIDYTVTARKSPSAVGLFIAWFAATNPDLTGGFCREAAEQLFPSLEVRPREEQLAAARAILNKPINRELLDHLRNELTDNWRWVKFRHLIKAKDTE